MAASFANLRTRLRRWIDPVILVLRIERFDLGLERIADQHRTKSSIGKRHLVPRWHALGPAVLDDHDEDALKPAVGQSPYAGLIADANGNLFGMTLAGGANNDGTVFEIAKTAGGFASTPTTLVDFGTDGKNPSADLIADANGNLFGTTQDQGENGGGTVFEIAKTTGGSASSPTTLVSFCSNCGSKGPFAGLIADLKGNLFGTTLSGATGNGTVFEITDSGFVPQPILAGTPGRRNCHRKPVSRLAQRYVDLYAAATALGYSSAQVLQNEIAAYCM